jgi:hypothetical protein
LASLNTGQNINATDNGDIDIDSLMAEAEGISAHADDFLPSAFVDEDVEAVA